MSTVFSAHAVSVDGYISGRTPIAAARAAARDKDVGLMGGGVVTEALKAGLVDELILHQVPVLLGGGRSFFHELPEHVHLRLPEAVPAPGMTHLRYEVVR
jgi:dihydrofolate reductase